MINIHHQHNTTVPTVYCHIITLHTSYTFLETSSILSLHFPSPIILHTSYTFLQTSSVLSLHFPSPIILHTSYTFLQTSSVLSLHFPSSILHQSSRIMEAFDAATLSPEQLDAICPCSPADRAAFVIPSLATTDSADLRTYLQELLLPYDDTLHAIDRELKYIHRKLGVLRINSDGKCAPVERMEDGGYRHHFWDSSRLKLGYADYQLFMMSLRKEPPKDIAMFYLDHYAEHRFEQGIVPPSRHRRDPVELRARRQRLKENQWLFKLQSKTHNEITMILI